MPFSFLFISDLLGRPVLDPDARLPLGRIVDLVADTTNLYPNVTGLILRRGLFGPLVRTPVPQVNITETGSIQVQSSADAVVPKVVLSPKELLLCATFLDKQIVDVSGARVVRVNDLHLLNENSNLWVVHMDIGFSGLLRRLGWLRPYRFVVKWLFNYPLEDRFLQWKYVQHLGGAAPAGKLALNIASAKLSNVHPADLADILTDLGTQERVNAFQALDLPTAAKTLEKLPLKISVQICADLPVEPMAKILDILALDEAVDILSELGRKKTNALLKLLPKKKVASIKELLKHSKHTAGSLMNTQFISVRFDSTAGQAMEKIKAEIQRAESIYYIYVLSANNSLAGVLTLRQLLLADLQQPVTDIMNKKVIKVGVETRIEDVAQLFLKYNFNLIPVVDSHNKIKGIISVRDALESGIPEIKEEMGGSA